MQDREAAWAQVRAFMQRKCGVVLAADQDYLMEARLGGIVRRAGAPSVEEWVAAACAINAPRALAEALTGAMTTHESYFFRDVNFWQGLQQVVLPRLMHGGARPLRVWAAACAAGQEPYSLAMLLREMYPAVAERCEIVATDVSQDILDQAAAGLFGPLEVGRGLDQARLKRYFAPAEDRYQIAAALRAQVTWRRHNLVTEAAPMLGCDLILCRNVLIYFADADRLAVLARCRGALAPAGLIGLGSTERGWGQPVAPGWFTSSVASMQAAAGRRA